MNSFLSQSNSYRRSAESGVFSNSQLGINMRTGNTPWLQSKSSFPFQCFIINRMFNIKFRYFNL
ncbi:hypothetical protein DERF_012979 [Dermatophagoides farinae]|uniref:Uncharacterized protein n=1 Tax=Dermatophagoides farinae TaxID=6954 RepID=A0A922HQK1_DERFA|nr:hypothetical protein DERF_012979 [Dermatophagoides farinae]